MKTSFPLYAVCLLLLCLWGCAKEEEFPLNQPHPILKTLTATPDTTGAEAVGEILSLGKDKVTEYGFAYTASSASASTYKVVVGTTAERGTFKASLTKNLVKGVSYNVQAYAVANGATVYGNKVVFNSTISAKPVIFGFSPASGPDGTHILITGESFSAKKEEIEVRLGSNWAQVVKASPDSIEIISPDTRNLGSFPITVTVRGQQKAVSETNFTVIGPTITRISANSGRPGEEVTIYGELLKNNSSRMPTVYFGSIQATVVSLTPTEMKVIVPTATYDSYDRPLSVYCYDFNKNMVLPTTFTIESGFRVASEMPSSIQMKLSGRLPSFLFGSKSFFFSYDRLISYHMGSGTWKDEGMFPGVPKDYVTLEQVGDKVYLLGGLNANKYYGDVWEYDYQQNTWTQKNSLPFAVYDAKSFALNGKIYFFGGTNSSSRSKLWQYDPETEAVQAMSPLPAYPNTGGAFFSGSNSYIILNSSLWAYNAQQDSWVRKKDVPGSYPTAYTYQGEGYVMSSNNLFRYDAAADQWTRVASYPGCMTNSIPFGFASADKFYYASIGTCSRTIYSYQAE